MNKKFSTLVATLLVAGAGMTLNAEVIKVTSPKVGGSYLIATSVIEGVADGGQVGGLLKIATGGASLDATTVPATSYLSVGGEWKLIDAEIEGETAFYLVKDGKYICAADAESDKTLDVSASVSADRIAFNIDGDKIVVAVGIDEEIVVGDELKIDATAVTLETSGSGTSLTFGTYQADKEVTYGTATAKLVTTPVKDTYYFIAAKDGKLLHLATKNGVASPVDASSASVADVAKYLWKVTESTVGTTTQYTFENKKFPDNFAKIGQSTSFTASGKYNKGVGLFVGASSVDAEFAAAGAVDAAIAFGFYQAIQLPYTVKDLKADLGGSFNLSIADASKTEGADVFNGNLVPMGEVAFDDPEDADADAGEKQYRLKSGEKFVVLNTKNIWAGNIGNEDLKRGAKFELVDLEDLENADYLSYFKISHTSGNDADKNLQVEVMNADQTDIHGRMFVVSAGENKYLTTSISKSDNETWVSVLKGASNIVDVKTLLGKFWNISYAESKEAAKEQNEEYKLNGVLTVVYDDEEDAVTSDYVDAGSVLLTSPEVQWAVYSVKAVANTFSITNREGNTTVKDLQLRTTDTPNVYSVISSPASNVTGDLIKLTEVKNHGKFDGFMRTDANILRNQVFHIGQYHNETGNAVAYWTENHGSNHKLGVSTENATDWKLSLDMKDGDKKNEVDTVLIITDMAVWEDGKFTDMAQPDTLAVLRYKFQNKSNLEYVLYKGDKLNYYACDEVADIEDNGLPFALKMKPNGLYNIIPVPFDSYLGSDKVYVANSSQKGSLGNMKTYAKDNNSLMVIEEIDKPEYRKVAKEWGDVVKIYREEYPTEMLFEKLDAKSVVDNDTLSFLNVNNSVTGVNPALFIDTAYVNRVDSNGVKNTCYQYLLAVNVDKKNTTFCPFDTEHNTNEWKEANGGPCPHAKANPTVVKGRFLINLVDTAFAYKQDHLHNNPYVNMVEANEDLAKLSFVDGYHSQDTLYITRKGGEVVKLAMNDPNFNVAKFAFHYVNNEDGSFKIQTQFKDYKSSASQTQKEFDESADNNGYLRWVNGTIVVTKSYMNGETFNMDEEFAGNPVSNEDDIMASSISVIATDGAVIIKGAEGKKVAISNILGQTLVNTAITSDNATISVPAGIVVVAVEGEAAVKAIIK